MDKHYTFHAIIFISALLCTSASHSETILLEKYQFHESYSENVKISGSVRTGVMYHTTSKYALPDALYIDIGNKDDASLCVKMVSVDGRYGAKFEYPLDGKTVGLTRFQVPTQLEDIFTSYKSNNIAVMAELKSPECKGKSKQILPASWGLPEKQILRVFLNSGVNSTYIKLYPLNGSSLKQTCNHVKAERGIAFDTECTIARPQQYILSKTTIIRKNFDNHFKPIKLKISK